MGRGSVLCLLLALPLAIIHKAVCVGSFLVGVVFGIWLLIHNSLSPSNREYHRRRTARNYASQELEAIEKELTETVSRCQRMHAELSQSAQELVSRCRGLPSEIQAELQRLASSLEAAARVRHLRLHLIAEADIDKIGTGRKQMLADNGILTAADIDSHSIKTIKGLGPASIRNLLTWKKKILQQFRFDPKTAVSPAEQRTLTVKFRAMQRQILDELGRQIDQLPSLAPECEAAVKKPIPGIWRADRFLASRPKRICNCFTKNGKN